MMQDQGAGLYATRSDCGELILIIIMLDVTIVSCLNDCHVGRLRQKLSQIPPQRPMMTIFIVYWLDEEQLVVQL